MARSISFEVGGIYHIYNRGTDRRVIFNDRSDYLRFICLLYASNDTAPLDVKKYFAGNKSFFTEGFAIPRQSQIVDIGAYALMPNHYHLFLHERVEGGISRFMQKLKTAYVMYFNGKNKRTGTLFESRFRARLVTDEQYLAKVFSYIHLNPVSLFDPFWGKEGLRDVVGTRSFLEQYEYSSYADYLGREARPQKAILNTDEEIWHSNLKSMAEFTNILDVWMREEDADKNALVESIEETMGHKRKKNVAEGRVEAAA